MKTLMKMVTCFLVLICMLALTACKGSDEQKPTTQTPEKTSEVEPDSSPDSAEKKNENSSSDKSTTTDSESKPQNPSNSSIDSKTSSQIKNLLEQAKQGKVPNVSFAAHTGDIEEVEKAWGEADKTEPAGKGMYATYTSQNAVIGFNKGSQIFDVRSNHPELRTLTLQEIEKVLGKPMSTKVNGNDKIYIYKANDQFELKFVIPNSTGKVDHISVFSPEDSINNMAG
ncbi:YjgB family protein [Bacillus bingmayongensis]|uniref:YjgB family protein n=1 Tax=Bacillus bingmayongensis TaxID=1150157 RepID=UPI00031C4294|nr:YjgB family protein [Bacillus bingmayongensis]MBY0597633.1 DUF4309 domain-containing protein [Bacillus bingmayongensis]